MASALRYIFKYDVARNLSFACHKKHEETQKIAVQLYRADAACQSVRFDPQKNIGTVSVLFCVFLWLFVARKNHATSGVS